MTEMLVVLDVCSTVFLGPRHLATSKQLQHLFERIPGWTVSEVWAMLAQFADRQGVPDVSI